MIARTQRDPDTPGGFLAVGQTVDGASLRPGYNVDRIDVGAGCARAAAFGYDDAQSQMVVEYALMRHRRGEEAGAQATALGGGIDLTSWYAILASAQAAAQPRRALAK